MRSALALVLCVTTTVLVTGCAAGRDPGNQNDPGGDSGHQNVSGSGGPTSGSAARDCLVNGSPWILSTTDLASQFPGVLRGIDVTGVEITGDQTLSVTADLDATILDNTVTTITVDMGDGLTMEVQQTHHSTAMGPWRIDGDTLVPDGHWDRTVLGGTTFTIEGRSVNSRFDVPDSDFGDVPLTFDCQERALNITAEGSPFVYLFE
ncbi:MAG TPA: hypothetical protein VL294_13730 [Pseudolysinimonas sp.]|nr:hypothetical protein [Pseudolysinimonas sp.]